MVEPEENIVVVTLGENSSRWRAVPRVRTVVTLRRASVSGRRAGSLALGLGLDALLVALKVTLTTRRGMLLATNPWIGASLSLMSRRPLAVTGIFAAPGSRSWRILRWILRKDLVIAVASVEAQNWRRAGGRATAVLYGNEFPYSGLRTVDNDGSPLRIFVGGTSDRDQDLLEELEKKVIASSEPTILTVAVGGPPGHVTGDSGGEVIRYPQMSQESFGQLMRGSDIVFLPLMEGSRAAGHMLIVGALQLGVPVVCTPCSGMAEYADGKFVRTVPGHDLIAEIRMAAADAPSPSEAHDYWRSHFDRDTYTARVVGAIFDAESRS